MIFTSMMLVSCLDTIILPDDKTVDEDFWKSKDDVAAMVNAAYAGMTSENVITRFIVWGDFRSDELVQSTNPTGGVPDALAEIAAVNIQPTNQYATWSDFYSVINRCNIVLARAGAVRSDEGGDPNYTQEDYLVDRSQMLALRSLCYFYLVRTFRDVPYITEAYMNSSQNMQVAQSSPNYVLQCCINDLEEASKNALSATGFTVNEWKRVGWMTLDGIKSLLADIYLWRASANHSAADYQRCADLCAEVIASKQKQHVPGRNELTVKTYPLSDPTDFYRDIFVDQNAEESIFEIQMSNNSAVCKYLYKYSSDTSGEGFLTASSIFGSQSTSVDKIGSNVFAAKDLRYYASCFEGTETHPVRKMIAQTPVVKEAQESRIADRNFAGFDQNYIIYRLTDVMLMRAEALVQLYDDTQTDDTLKRAAFKLVQAVNTRSLLTEADSIKWGVFSGFDRSQMELLVMQERLRELCFEGKRWYDLMRYHYRHAEGVDFNRTFGQMTDDSGNMNMVKIYDNMLDLMVRARGADAAGVKAKMRGEPFLYMPIPNADINVCPLLKQNPAYQSSNEYIKSY